MKNYYEILEVDIHASKEIIDKAFKTLAKKYHPDTKEAHEKEFAEEQFKLLNEAYETLSDELKRKEYTKELESNKNSEVEALMLKNADLEVQIENLQAELNILRNNANSQSYYNSSIYQHENFENSNNFQNTTYNNTQNNYSYSDQQYDNNINEPQYYESYYHPIKSKFKNFLAFFITLGVIIFILIVIWNIPYTHNFLVEMYKENFVIKSIVDFFI